PHDTLGITRSLLANRLETQNIEQTFWWLAEIHGLSAGTFGIRVYDDCAELVGLTVEPLFRGKGLGHAMVEYASDQWFHSKNRKRISAKAKGPLLDHKLWVVTG